MGDRIDSDLGRFKQIVREKVKRDIGKFVGSERLITQNGAGKKISVPLDYINMPHFTFGGKDKGGTGQDDGSGEPGDAINGGKKGNGKGKGAGNDGSGDGSMGTEFEPSELAQILREHLELENLEDRGTGKVDSEKSRYNKITNIGNESLRNMRRTYKEAIKRSVSDNTYDYRDPKIVIQKNDKRYRASSTVDKPDINCLLMFIMDDSGSMGEKEKHLVKATAFWIDLLIRDQYKNIEILWMVFDTEAHLVSKEDFFRISSGGGTRVSSALALSKELLETKYTRASTNSYLYMFSDGDDASDGNKCLELMNEGILPQCNKFCYGQVAPDGNFIKHMTTNFDNHPKVASAVIDDDEGILPAIKTFFTPKG